jgi:hypothetical protein
MARKLTDKQMQTLRFIYDYIKSNGYAPTLKEIGEALGVSPFLACFSQIIACWRILYLMGNGCLRKPETGQKGLNIALTEKGILACEGEK